MGLNSFVKLGDNLKKIRKSQRMSQKDMANFLDINYSTYSNYENNNRTPDTNTLLHIAKKLGINVFDLIGIDKFIADNSKIIDDPDEPLVQMSISKTGAQILIALQQLNEDGEKKVLEFVNLIAKVPEYHK